MLDKNKEDQQAIVSQFQSEIRTLKTFLLNRQIKNDPCNSDSLKNSLPIAKPAIPSWQIEAVQNTIQKGEEKAKENSDRIDNNLQEIEEVQNDTVKELSNPEHADTQS